MNWENSKEGHGWDPIFMPESLKYLVAMRILFPQSVQIKLHYLSEIIKRNRTRKKEEDINVWMNIVNYSYKHELETLFSGLSSQKRFELQMKLLGKISIGPFWKTNLTKESFMDIWRNPDIYKVLDWDITAPWDSDKNEYDTNKVKYSISYEQFRLPIKTIKRKSTLELYRAIEMMSNLGKDWKSASYVGRTGNQYYMQNGTIKVQKYKP